MGFRNSQEDSDEEPSQDAQALRYRRLSPRLPLDPVWVMVRNWKKRDRDNPTPEMPSLVVSSRDIVEARDRGRVYVVNSL